MTAARAMAPEARRLTLAEVGPREFTTIEPGYAYRLAVPGVMVTFDLDRLLWHSNQELTGELLVRCELGGTDAINGVLSVASFNVSSARARMERANQLAKQARAPDLPWAPLLEELCQRVLTAERSDDSSVVLRDVARVAEDERRVWVSGFAMPWRHPSCLFGDGGVCKSYLAMYLATLMAEEGATVGLFDWELDEYDHRVRLGDLYGEVYADMPASFIYRKCRRPLIHEIDGLKRLVRQRGITFAVFDSVGYACHEAPEDATSALSYFRAVRTLGIGSLHIAHINKAESGDQKPFGSSYWYNSVRACWNLKATEDRPNHQTLGVFDRKPNLRARQPPFALDVTFTEERTTFRRAEITEVQEFAPQLTTRQRMTAALQGGAKHVYTISEELGIPENTVLVTVKRGLSGPKPWLMCVSGSGRLAEVGLRVH